MFITCLTALLTGCLAGLVGALLGVSGGIVMLPANQFILGLSPLAAVGTSLFAAVFTTLSGAYGHFHGGNVQVKKALLISAGGLVGVFSGSYIFEKYLSANILLLQFLLGLLFLSMAVRMGRETWQEWRGNGKSNPFLSPAVKSEAVILIMLGLVTGIIAGVFGVGGGFIIVPALIWFFAAEPYEAVGTALLAMLPYVATGGLIKLQQGFVDLQLGLLLGLGTIIGAQLGVVGSKRINPLTFKILFTLIFIYLAWKYMHPFLQGAG